MASDQVEVSVEGAFVLELADVDIEEVDGEGRRQDVGDREDEGHDRDVCQEGDTVSMPDRYMDIYEKDVQYVFYLSCISTYLGSSWKGMGRYSLRMR